MGLPCNVGVQLAIQHPLRGKDWHGSGRLIRTLMYVGVKERVFSSWGTAWQIQRYGSGMGIQFYYRLILFSVIMSDMIIWEGRDFTYLECGVGRSRPWWQAWGGRLWRIGLEEPGEGRGLTNWVGFWVNGGCSLIWEGERNSEQQSKGHLLGQKLQERKAYVNPGNAVGCQEREQKNICRGRKRGTPSFRSSGEFSFQHSWRPQLQVEHSERQPLPRLRGAETTEQLTFGHWRAEPVPLCGLRNCRKMYEGDKGAKAREGPMC